MQTSTQETLPSWTLEDAYGSVQDVRFQNELQNALTKMQQLKDRLDDEPSKEQILDLMPIYEDAVESISSLISFSYCASSADITDTQASAAYAQTQSLSAELEAVAKPIFSALGKISAEDPFWNNAQVSHWRFGTMEKKNSWRAGLKAEENAIINAFASTNFYPVDAMYKRLNKSLLVEAKNSQGETVHLTHSQCVGVLKGADDPVLRETAQEAVNAWYKEHAGYYVDLLNLLHGFRKTQFSIAGVTDWMRPSLEQNRISREALTAALEAIKNRQSEIQEAITVRAPFFGRKVMKACDFFAPIPVKSTGKAYIPYKQAIETVKASLVDVNPEIPAFIDMMLEKHWLDAKVDAKKAGGAFYSRFNRLKQPRVFTTYLGSFGSVLQQSHELGHAFHGMMIENQPVLNRDYCMPLAETASTFNENIMYNALQKDMNDHDKLLVIDSQLSALCQNILDIYARFQFETLVFEHVEEGFLTADQLCELMKEALLRSFGDGLDPEWLHPYRWITKVHYYIPDIAYYNFPYTFGALFSRGLYALYTKQGKDFIPKYEKLLAATTTNTCEDVAKIADIDLRQETFWKESLQSIVDQMDEFLQLAKGE